MKKGSITVYLSLILCVMISLIFAAMDSARLSCGRAITALAAEEGMFSLFSEYDRILYEKYGLLVIDGGYGSPELKAGLLLNRAADAAEKVLAQGSLFDINGSSNLFRAGMENKAVTGYVLATDSEGKMLKDQIKALMTRKLGIDVLSAMCTYYTGAAAAAESAESFDLEKMDNMKADLEEGKSAADEARRAAEEAERAAAEAPGGRPDTPPAVSPQNEDNSAVSEQDAKEAAGAADIIENIYALKRLGIMAAAVPDISRISAAQIDVKNMPSKRTVLTGMGVLPAGSSSIADAVLLARYITDFFPAFTDNDESGSFRYQAEYVIAGKGRDVENLKSVLNRLLVIRMALNYAYLLAHPEKTQEAGALALTISSVLLVPQFFELVRQIILLCWSYGESMLDIKELLSGGKVPLIKDDVSWHSSLSGLASLSAESAPGGSDKGLNYKDYLCILLVMKGSGRLMKGVEDLLEYNRRLLGSEPGFSIDTCVCSMELQFEGSIGIHSFVHTRRYGYDTVGL